MFLALPLVPKYPLYTASWVFNELHSRPIFHIKCLQGFHTHAGENTGSPCGSFQHGCEALKFSRRIVEPALPTDQGFSLFNKTFCFVIGIYPFWFWQCRGPFHNNLLGFSSSRLFPGELHAWAVELFYEKYKTNSKTCQHVSSKTY